MRRLLLVSHRPVDPAGGPATRWRSFVRHEVDVICGLLRTEGIEAKCRQSFPSEERPGIGYYGRQEILVPELTSSARTS